MVQSALAPCPRSLGPDRAAGHGFLVLLNLQPLLQEGTDYLFFLHTEWSTVSFSSCSLTAIPLPTPWGPGGALDPEGAEADQPRALCSGSSDPAPALLCTLGLAT